MLCRLTKGDRFNSSQTKPSKSLLFINVLLTKNGIFCVVVVVVVVAVVVSSFIQYIS